MTSPTAPAEDSAHTATPADAITMGTLLATLTTLDQTLPVVTDTGHAVLDPQPVMPSLDFEFGDTSDVIAGGLTLPDDQHQSVAEVTESYTYALDVYETVGATRDSPLLVAAPGVGVVKVVGIEPEQDRVVLRTAA